ncbi:hypothetical protein HUJ04_011871 [Dendroctonus ponderosae]|nr:hypothetical protein HUJ04_011871 [Dendroctonus ponderosae]
MPITAADINKMFRTAKYFDGVLNKASIYWNMLQRKVTLNMLSEVNVTALANGKCTAELTLEEEHTNIMGGLHGGLSATLVDCISSYALVSKTSLPHVSVQINTEYIKGAKLGDQIEIFGNTVKMGKSLAFLEVLIKDKNTGALLVKGSHTKFLLGPKE